jgi:enoyl-CoA hydratase
VEIDLVVTEGIALITLNAPERRNAISPAMAKDLIERLDQVDDDPNIGALVLTGSGKGFCSGADLSTLSAAGDDPLANANYDGLTAIYGSFRRFGSMSIPTIAAVQGSAVGAGLNLALAADLRIVADGARLLSGFIRLGLHPGGGHFQLLSRLVSRETLAALALFGEELDGPAAVQLGLAWRSLPADEVLPAAMRLAQRIAVQPELARAMVATLRAEVPPAMSWDAAIQLERGPQMRTLHQRARATGGADD